MVNSVTLRRITIKSQNTQNETKNISCKLNLQSHSGARVVYYVVHKGEARVLHTAVREIDVCFVAHKNDLLPS